MSGGRINPMTGVRVERARMIMPKGVIQSDRKCVRTPDNCCEVNLYPGMPRCFPMMSIPGTVYVTFASAVTLNCGLGRALAKSYPLCHGVIPWYLSMNGSELWPFFQEYPYFYTNYAGPDPAKTIAPLEAVLRPWDYREYWETTVGWWGLFGFPGGEAEMRARWTRRCERVLNGTGSVNGTNWFSTSQWTYATLGQVSEDQFWFVNDESQSWYNPETGNPIVALVWSGVPTAGAPGGPQLYWTREYNGWILRFGGRYGGSVCDYVYDPDGNTPPPLPSSIPDACLEEYFLGVEGSRIYSDPPYYRSALNCSRLFAVMQLRFPNTPSWVGQYPGPYTMQLLPGEEDAWSRAYPGGYWAATPTNIWTTWVYQLSSGGGLPMVGFTEQPQFFTRGVVNKGMSGTAYHYSVEPATTAAVSGPSPAPSGGWVGTDGFAPYAPERLSLTIEELDLEYLTGGGGLLAGFTVGVTHYSNLWPYWPAYLRDKAIRRTIYPMPSLRIQMTLERPRGAACWSGDGSAWGHPARATLEMDRPYRPHVNETFNPASPFNQLRCRSVARLSLSIGSPLFVTGLAYACDGGYEICPVTTMRWRDRDFYAYMAYETGFVAQMSNWIGTAQYPSGYILSHAPFFWKLAPPPPRLVWQTYTLPDGTKYDLPAYYDGLDKFAFLQVAVDPQPVFIDDPRDPEGKPRKTTLAPSIPVTFQISGA